ncbi:sugar phosphate isomerase/epimerase family protein [Paenibacillus aceris]|uniref:Sugar phosphate isomerase/epimerase n=1 Tax=Paenibacillus aceris TaxID=869555 RepID=A0ABS4I6U5_9BACL|nr:TIM barrel protein [Paenibacillus aceris]MBP1966440.1 sugar phosphate isomerase/epimerase [Paenibacillus aceris]NHW39578.1 sugar phosphate isomerase/epimerase [Paenibacillus aceris]
MMKLTGFADEISPDLMQQIAVCKGEQIQHIEFRSVWNTNVLKLKDGELLAVKAALESNQMLVSAIGSPIGKIGILDDFEDHLLALERAFYVAKLFGTKFIRMFSFILPPGDELSKHREEVMHRIKRMVKRAEEENVILLLENESGMYGDTPDRCLDVLETCASLNLRQAFDPGNFLQSGVNSTVEAFHTLKPYISYIHVKDVTLNNGKEVPAGKGDGHLIELLGQLQSLRYDGFLSLEPHLVYSGMYPDHTPVELFEIASQALKGLLKTIDEDWI